MKISGKVQPAGQPHGDSDDWRAESDLRTLIEAEKIKADKARYKRALAKRDEMRGHLSSVRSPRS